MKKLCYNLLQKNWRVALAVIWTIIILGLLIFVHEWGHFLMARFCGVSVKTFSLGFGPKVISKRWGETEYVISAFPLGGYVKLLGESPLEFIPEPDKRRAFSYQSVWKRSLIVLGGPLFNLLFALFIFILIFAFAGKPIMLPQIGNVQQNSPAAQAGLKKGDIILAIDGQNISSWEQLALEIKKHGQRPIRLRIKRKNEILELTVKPQIQEIQTLLGDKIKKPIIGITAAGTIKIEKVSPFRALIEGTEQTWMTIKLTLITLKNLILGKLSFRMLVGPIGIVQLTTQEAKAGVAALFSFAALISINLGIINLFPLPVLDGGYLFMYAIEAIRRRPFSAKTIEITQKMGIIILVLLMILVMYNDILRIFNKTALP